MELGRAFRPCAAAAAASSLQPTEMMRERMTTLVADEQYPSGDLLETGTDDTTSSLVAISDEAIPVQAVDDERLVACAIRVGAEYFAPLIDGVTSMTQMSARAGIDLDIVRTAILRLALHGAVTFVNAPAQPRLL